LDALARGPLKVMKYSHLRNYNAPSPRSLWIRSIDPPERATKPGAAIILTTTALLSVLPLIVVLRPSESRTWTITAIAGLAILTIAGALTRSTQALHLGAFCTLTALLFTLPAFGPWPLPLIVSLVTYAAVVLIIPKLRRSVGWVRVGTASPGVLAAIAATIILSGVALLLWYLLLRPDVSKFRATIPEIPLWALPLAGLGWAAVNAAAEEAVYRGIVMHALDSAVGAGAWSMILQAASFGVLHINGFPSGLWGIAMSFVYGLMLGVVRRLSRGMLAPWLAHLFADVTIFAILVMLVQ